MHTPDVVLDPRGKTVNKTDKTLSAKTYFLVGEKGIIINQIKKKGI